MTTVTIGIYLVDDHEIVRRGLADLLNQVSGFNVVGEASCVREASDGIPECDPTWSSWTSDFPTATVWNCAGNWRRPVRKRPR
ncbi:hypothetical protein N806_25245 [Rhodococcus sp. P27]|nr:hypothetical protein N806_25245 [Rhodococcus sp. P27]